ncbi:hypothetical protein DFH08DRAFT_1025801 [Mycena albidolilacea]|uniref:Zn(2)-C6 fungal-type domain-containing protein n=1 Tax=Mycena albidolilacea TaxID=1033008 RepID=A0AAD7AN49_9AGAR|nr:hypothetical protein DFH08DRAFT_1025801 [Mycena albidolilacea]
MPSARIRQKRLPKPPACDPCKARRVLCHPQPNGAPCPRCVEKSTVCTTTPVPRGRPRKHPKAKSATPPAPETGELESTPAVLQTLSQASSPSLPQSPTQASSFSMNYSPPQIDNHTPELIFKTPVQASSSPPNLQVCNNLADCPDLTPDNVAHFFDCFFDQLSLGMNPIIIATSIKKAVQAASFQLSLLSPQVRVLGLCIIALASRISFHEAVLGPGPRPASFTDPFFFLASDSQADVRKCGARRAKACRALHAAALKAAWDTGIILQVSPQNAASCFLLDILEQDDFVGLARPWACAYMSHVRALAPMWRSSTMAPPDSSGWAGFLVSILS